MGGQFTFSNTGTFAYLSGQSQGGGSYPMLLMDTLDHTVPAVAQPGIYGAPRFSRDGKLLAYIASDNKGFDVWVYDLQRRISTQLTFQGTANHEVAWARDSRHLVYGDGTRLWWIRADGSGQAQILVDKMANPRPTSKGIRSAPNLRGCGRRRRSVEMAYSRVSMFRRTGNGWPCFRAPSRKPPAARCTLHFC